MLDDSSFQTKCGNNLNSIIAIIGNNSAGKSNILKALDELNTQFSFRATISGTFELDGEEIIDGSRSIEFTLTVNVYGEGQATSIQP